MDTSIQSLLKMKKFIFWINSQTPNENKSKQDWNTPIHLKNDGQHIKKLLIFLFLIMNFNLCFHHNCGLSGYVFMLEIGLNILNKIIRGSGNVCECLKLNRMHIKFASLIIWPINDNLTNTSSKPLSEVKKVLHIIHLITLGLNLF